jgi:hypothetical protein
MARGSTPSLIGTVTTAVSFAAICFASVLHMILCIDNRIGTPRSPGGLAGGVRGRGAPGGTHSGWAAVLDAPTVGHGGALRVAVTWHGSNRGISLGTPDDVEWTDRVPGPG